VGDFNPTDTDLAVLFAAVAIGVFACMGLVLLFLRWRRTDAASTS